MTSFPVNSLRKFLPRPEIGISALLVLAVLAVYWPVQGFAFIDFDDGDYIFQNPPVLAGLSASGWHWAFTQFYDGNWHPLTWLSHQLDVQIYGLNAGGHHVTSLWFHAVNTVLVFLWLQTLTGRRWRSALVAALFGLHPLHVESVAWVAERKDVLSAFFFLLTLLAYTRFARADVTGGSDKKWRWYGLALGLFAFSLLAKPMSVTLPCVLLLLDFWPLNRLRLAGFRLVGAGPVMMEKIPFIILSAASCAITLLAQKSSHAIMPMQFLPWEARWQNTLVAYARYLGKVFWPESLVAYYPLTFPIPVVELWLAGTVLLLVTLGVIYALRRHAFLFIGWFWFLGMLVPVIGLLQVGSQAMADRYAYLPVIGIFIALVWLVAEMKPACPGWRWFLSVLALTLLAGCGWFTARQVMFWQNSETLARHAVAVSPKNALMQGLLGSALLEQQRTDEAGEHFAIAARIWPDNPTAQAGLAMTLLAQNQAAAAAAACQTGLKYHPEENQLHNLLGQAYTQQGNPAAAISEYEIVLQKTPDQLLALNNLAWLLATVPEASLRDGTRAVQLAGQACELTQFQRPMFLGTLAAAYAEAGRFDEAITTAQKAIALASAAGNSAVARKNRELLTYYQSRQPYHEPVHP